MHIIIRPRNLPHFPVNFTCTQVRLPPGNYQVGLLVVDDTGATNAIAQKNIQDGAGPLPPPPPPPSPVGGPGGPPAPPVIPVLDTPLVGESGGIVRLPSITGEAFGRPEIIPASCQVHFKHL